MDGNQSLLNDISLQLHCGDILLPCILNVAFGLPANMCVIWLILVKPGCKVAEILTLNQAVSEVAICFANILFFFLRNSTLHNMSALFWYSFRFTLGFMYLGRPLFMSLICFERYLAVVYPVVFLRYKPCRYRLAVAIGSWLTVLVCSTTLIWIPEPEIYFVVFGMAFPWFPVQLFCCVETLRTLVRTGPGEENQSINRMSNVKLNAFKIIMIIVVGSAVYNIPYIFTIILFGHISREETGKMFCIANYTALIIWFMSPLLYLLRFGLVQHCISRCSINISSMTPEVQSNKK